MPPETWEDDFIAVALPDLTTMKIITIGNFEPRIAGWDRLIELVGARTLTLNALTVNLFSTFTVPG
jgi:hypothetical protein